MAKASTARASAPASNENFAELLDEIYGGAASPEGSVVRGRVIAVENDFALIDVGLKSEGRVPLKEFAQAGKAAEVKVGDTVEVFLERMENANGEAVLSRDKARREEAWEKLEQSFNANMRVDGVIFGRVKGGFT
ncbi:MAG: S1 RNA-binding domain-containing protein, partial [Alphaproteobacteria bacterium]|nr:S1 RNA-binding domain-containing protein [Alphaproteobacteria bacterium]